MFITEWNITNTDDSRELQAWLQEAAPRLLEQEIALRAECICEPDFFSGELNRLEEFHALVAREMTTVFFRWGWPGLSLLNWESAKAVADLARFCWSQPVFMRSCLPLLEQAYRFGDVAGEWFAKHYDTIMFFENKPQVYGTFLDWDKKGILVAPNIVDRPRVQERRGAILMEKHSEFLRKERLEAENLRKLAPSDFDRFQSDRVKWALRVGWERRP